MAESSGKNFARIIHAARWIAVLLPVLICGWLVKTYVVDQRFLDDWVWAQDLLLWKKGAYGELLHNIVSVHLEHRPVVARALALAVTLLANGNVQAQCGLTFLWLILCLGALFRLWMRPGLLELRTSWPVWTLITAILFTPMQWQTLLWPICHETPMPVVFLLLAFCLAESSKPWWVRSLLGAFCAILGMLSFASGFLLWVLPLPVLLWNGRFGSDRQRWKFVLLWGLVFFVTMLFYLKVGVQPVASIVKEKTLLHLPAGYDLTYDLHNEVPSQYAYHHGEENTMNGEFAYFIKNPVLAMQFVATFAGAILTRGWSADLKACSQSVGWLLLALLAGAVMYFWRHRKDESLRPPLLTALCFAGYTPLTALMVAVGRMYAGGAGSALNGRYTVHQTQLLIGLIVAAVLILRHALAAHAAAGETARSLGLGWASGGLLMGVVFVGWIHGQAMMFEWQAARFRAGAAQFLSDVFPTYNTFVAFVAGGYDICRQTSLELNKYGLLRRGLAQTTILHDIWRESKPTTELDRRLARERAQFQQLYKDAAGAWHTKGFAYIPKSYRPADAIIFAYRVPGGKWTMFGFTQATGIPHYLARSLGKDLYSFAPGHDPVPTRMTCAWDRTPYILADPPAGAMISAWALDFYGRKITRINRTRKGTPDPEDGLPLADLATDSE